jgi:nitrite reductase/ring-hydroxylating ferredoxin subunit
MSPITSESTRLDEITAERLDPDGTVGENVEAGRTLPSSWYTDPQIFELERKSIFRRAWEYVGHRGRVENPGDYFTCEVGGVPIVIVCDKGGTVRGFVNICRHRHHTVALGAGNRPSLQCSYHAWTYKLDGSLSGAPRSKEESSFDGSALCLKPVSVGFLGNMLFANPDSEAPPLEEVLGPIPGLGRERGFPFDEATFQQKRVVDFDANWKIGWDNNCECYHCPTVHNSWYKKAKLDKDHVYSYPIGPFHFEVVMDQDPEMVPDYSFYCWPSVCITSSGGAGKVDALEGVHDGSRSSFEKFPGFFAWRFVPVSARTSRIELDVYCIEDLTDEQLDEWYEVILSVVHEDRDVCNRVQEAHDSEAGELGTLIPAIDSEFHTLTWERLLHRSLVHPDRPLYEPMLEPSSTWPKAFTG